MGDFVGDYMDPNNDHIQENILVMDADGQNLVMMNPNDTISHSHEIEFDFDSFGPESIIYAGNVEAIGEKANGTGENVANDDGDNPIENGSEGQQQQQQQSSDAKDASSCEDGATSKDNAHAPNGLPEGKGSPGE